ATAATFKGIKVGQVATSRRNSSEPHDLSAAWANRRFWRGVFVGHGQPSFSRDVPDTLTRALCVLIPSAENLRLWDKDLLRWATWLRRSQPQHAHTHTEPVNPCVVLTARLR